MDGQTCAGRPRNERGDGGVWPLMLGVSTPRCAPSEIGWKDSNDTFVNRAVARPPTTLGTVYTHLFLLSSTFTLSSDISPKNLFYKP